MNPNIRMIYRCPYCRGNQGVIAVDAVALVECGAAPAKTRKAWQAIDLRRTPGQRVITFGEDGASPEPCPHTVNFWVETQAARRGAVATTRGADADWNHPWFDGGEPSECRGDVHAHLWEHLTSDDYLEYYPRVPYLIQRSEVRWPAESEFEGYALGWYVVAADPAAFFEALRDSERRLQEFWSTPRQG